MIRETWTTLEMACNKLVAFDEQQAARVLSAVDPLTTSKQVQTVLRTLVARRFLCTRQIATALPAVRQSIDSYEPHEPVTRERCAKVIAVARAKWREADTRLRTLFFAMPKAFKIFGHSGHKGFIPHAALSHDIAMAEVFTTFVEARPKAFEQWRLEPGGFTREKFEKQPDAMIGGRFPRFIEIIGEGYDEQRVGLLFQHAKKHGLPMEVY